MPLSFSCAMRWKIRSAPERSTRTEMLGYLASNSSGVTAVAGAAALRGSAKSVAATEPTEAPSISRRDQFRLPMSHSPPLLFLLTASMLADIAHRYTITLEVKDGVPRTLRDAPRKRRGALL